MSIPGHDPMARLRAQLPGGLRTTGGMLVIVLLILVVLPFLLGAATP